MTNPHAGVSCSRFTNGNTLIFCKTFIFVADEKGNTTLLLVE